MRRPADNVMIQKTQQALDAALRSLIVAALILIPASSYARTIDNVAAIQREARILADVMNSSLRGEMSEGVRVSSVRAEYLAKQGVLVSVRLNAPWLTINDNDTAVEINGQINLQEIPSMVEDILAELQIDVSPYEPEALEVLRSLRTEQRELREEQREIRSKLRESRRALVRATEDDERAEEQDEIDELERELLAVGAQYDALATDIDIQYQELRDYRGGGSTPAPKRDAPNYDELIARTVCDYGATLKSLSAQNFLTVALRRDETTDYYAFKMDNIYSCSNGDTSVERLLELAFQYQG